MAFPKTSRSKLKRLAERGHYDREAVYKVLDAGSICHVGIAPEGQPYVIPTLYARMGNEIVFHGAMASRLLKYAQNGGEICITVTLVDGLVLARSLFHHSINYRSVVVFGTGRLLEGQEKLKALEAISEYTLPGRWADARQPNPKELHATRVVAVEIDEASAKIRAGGAVDEPEDYELPVWAGVVPLKQVNGNPEPDEQLPPDIPIPEYLKGFLIAD